MTTPVASAAVPAAIANFEDSNFYTQLNCEVYLMNIIEGFLDLEEEWMNTCETDSWEAYSATLQSASDPSYTTIAGQKTAEYNQDVALAGEAEDSYNAIMQKGKSSLANATSSMSSNYEKELPIDTQTATLSHLLEKFK